MKFLLKNPFLLLCLLCLHTSCDNSKKVNVKKIKQAIPYVCEPCGGSCDDLIFKKAGKCPHCGMKLINKSSKSTTHNQKEISICFYLQDNVEILDFAGPLEVFTAAGYTVFIVSNSTEPITTQGTLKIIPEYSIENAPESNVMAFFGGSHGKPMNDPKVISWIKSRKKMTEY
jgi:DNA-directed RNA polymerase subunit RPC12/RpoP